jgi:protein LSM14
MYVYVCTMLFPGKHISLISKKNIRYEGVLYSINEQNATVALQNVRTFGTEGREEGGIPVAPTDTVHLYLLFRGQDIKDLHVHEQQPEEEEPPVVAAAAAAVASVEPPTTTAAEEVSVVHAAPAPSGTATKRPPPAATQPGRGARRPRNHKAPPPAVGTGASLLNRTARGATTGAATPHEDFDFQSSLEQFQKSDDVPPLLFQVLSRPGRLGLCRFICILPLQVPC